MVVINLTPEQTKLIGETDETVYLRDESGMILGSVSRVPKESPFTPEEIELFLQRAKSEQPGYTFDQILARFKALEAEGK